MRRQTIVILALLALCLLVVPAAGWKEDFQSGTAYGWTFEAISSGTVSIIHPEEPYDNLYQDTYVLQLKTGSASGSRASATANPGQFFNYAAFTVLYRKSYLVYMIRCELLNENGNVICGFDGGASYGWPYPSRIEIVRSGTTAYLYVNGVQKASAACSSQPYNIRFVVTSATSENYNWLRIDDVVIGTTGYPNIIGIIPEDWYVLKHPTDPRWSGLYDGNGNWIYHTMHVTYGLDDLADANTRIVLQPMGSGYFLNTTYLPVGKNFGVVTSTSPNS